MPDNVNWEFIRQREESPQQDPTEGYVPHQGGKAIENSGVTIGTGIDLGQMNAGDLEALHVAPALEKILLPYRYPMRGQPAYVAYYQTHKFQSRNVPALKLIDSQEEELNECAKRYNYFYLGVAFDAQSNFGVPEYEDLPGRGQTAIMDMAWQFGPKKLAQKSFTRPFWKAVITGNWKQAESALRHYTGPDPGRRKLEADVIQAGIQLGELPAFGYPSP